MDYLPWGAGNFIYLDPHHYSRNSTKILNITNSRIFDGRVYYDFDTFYQEIIIEEVLNKSKIKEVLVDFFGPLPVEEVSSWYNFMLAGTHFNSESEPIPEAIATYTIPPAGFNEVEMCGNSRLRSMTDQENYAWSIRNIQQSMESELCNMSLEEYRQGIVRWERIYPEILDEDGNIV